MVLKDFVFDLEDLEYELKSITCIALAVSEQLCQELNEDNEAIIHGLVSLLIDLHREMEQLKDRGFENIRK